MSDARSTLPSWSDGPTRRALISFVTRVTQPGSADHVEPEARIAVFDNDGTLWSEQPTYVQAFFVLDRIRALAPQHPEWTHTEPFASLLKNDQRVLSRGGEKALVELVMATHAGMTTEEFEKLVRDWIAQARHPRTKLLYTEMVYQPMLELLAYLRYHDFKTFIVSGGGIEFLRPWARAVYGIPPERVVGSSIKTRFETSKGAPVLKRLPEVSFVNDGAGKPEGIQSHIGCRPLLAFGNSDGDLQMLQWTTSKRPSLGVLLHHTDDEREWAYDRHALVGKLDRALDLAPEAGWLVVDMKRDWKVVYRGD
ncbi:MAG: HAD family hydrolase [Myxococcales bacterium]